MSNHIVQVIGSMGLNLLIVDRESAVMPKGKTVVLWRSFASKSNTKYFSIPSYVELHAVQLRQSYLSQLHDYAHADIEGASIAERLMIRGEFSYWWMTLLAENCNFAKSHLIDDAIRMLGFDRWASDKDIASITIEGDSRELNEALKSWCARRNIDFVWKKTGSRSAARHLFAGLIIKHIPYCLQAAAWLVRHLALRWSLKGVGLDLWIRSQGEISFFSYLFNMSVKEALRGNFQSAYWDGLPNLVHGEGFQSNWLHVYVASGPFKVSKEAAAAIVGLNDFGGSGQVHVTLDTFLGVRQIVRAIRDYFNVAAMYLKVDPSKVKVGQDMHSPDLWAFFAEDWRQSMLGKTAIGNLLYLNLFEAALKVLPKQKAGVYLQENQGWESGLIHAWRAAGHGRLIGVPHSTVRFWDLRYFSDPQSYRNTASYRLPLPDVVATNGAVATKAYLDGGYTPEALVEVEALRYLQLKSEEPLEISGVDRGNQALNILVLGDFLPVNSMQQIKLLQEALVCIERPVNITVKPHPACPIDMSIYPSISAIVTDQAISGLFGDCDIAFVSAATSAALDAYCAGVKVVIVSDPSTMNLSPLRGCDGVSFVESPGDLASVLNAVVQGTKHRVNSAEFFTIDPKLPRWRKLLLESIL